MLKRLLTLLAGIIVCLGGCAARRPMASVNDRSRADYEIVAVDGQPEVRDHHPFTTVIPVVLVEPGSHTFTVRERFAYDKDYRIERHELVAGSPTYTVCLPEFDVIAVVEADKDYRIQRQGDRVVIVEDADQQPGKSH